MLNILHPVNNILILFVHLGMTMFMVLLKRKRSEINSTISISDVIDSSVRKQLHDQVDALDPAVSR